MEAGEYSGVTVTVEAQSTLEIQLRGVRVSGSSHRSRRGSVPRQIYTSIHTHTVAACAGIPFPRERVWSGTITCLGIPLGCTPVYTVARL